MKNEYSPIIVDLILRNALVLTMDDDLRQFENGAVAVRGDAIVDAGENNSILQKYSAEEIMDCHGKVLLPGLINAHTHVPMTLLRGLADDLRLDVWLQGYMWPVEREFVSPDFVRLGTLLACAEMIRSGITCFADMYYFEEYVAQATVEAGMRGLCSQSILKFPTPDARAYDDSLALTREFIMKWNHHPLITPSVAPHAPYTCTPEILRATSILANEFDVPLHTHLAETSLEVENSRNEYGMPVIPYVKKQGMLDAKVLAAHCVHIDEGEMRTLLHAGAGVAHNPSSNMKLASGFAPVQKMLDAGLNVGIGTDGPASNNDLDMFEEIRLAAFMAKVVNSNPTSLPASQALSMGTRLGANALHLGSIIGTIEPGKKADLILVNISSIHNSPRFRRENDNVSAQIVYAGKASDVTDVMVNGKWLMQDRNLLTLNEKELLLAAQEYAQKIDTFLIAREQSVFSKLVALGGSAEEESFEVQVKVRLDNPMLVEKELNNPKLKIIRVKHYHQHDVYFSFSNENQGYLRYREDERLDERGNIIGVRARLTLIGPTREDEFSRGVLLSRIRFFAPATNSLRFYREYFKPETEIPVDKDRMRWLVQYQDEEFFINLDKIELPTLGWFLEIKSRTWSRRDAEEKAICASELITLLGGSTENTITKDYMAIAQGKGDE